MEVSRRFSIKEEIANAISHGLGVVFGIVALTLMVVFSVKHGNVWHITSFSIFGATMIILYLSSTFNHALPFGTRTKDFFHNFDQIAIYLLIAGTYTPLSLVVIRNDWGWVMFGIEWVFALAGIIIKIAKPNSFALGVKWFYIISYIIMGWLLLFFLNPLYRNMEPMGMGFIFIGGGCYTLGTLFFRWEKLNYNHLIWHIFVLAGSACHWIAILFYVLPWD